VEHEHPWSLDAVVADTRAAVTYMQGDIKELRHDVRRLDDRLFQVLLIQLATLATALGSLVTAFLSVTR
jgi:hypothetical protein